MDHGQPERNRRSVRLRGWDYAEAGLYSVTVCVYGKAMAFGKVEEDEVRLSEVGRVVEDLWREIPDHHSRAVLDAFVVMPNHVHGIIGLQGDAPEHRGPFRPGPGSLPVVVGSFKAAVTRALRAHLAPDFGWQRGYHEHVIRSERALVAIRRYIEQNPLRWALDRENPIRNQAL